MSAAVRDRGGGNETSFPPLFLGGNAVSCRRRPITNYRKLSCPGSALISAVNNSSTSCDAKQGRSPARFAGNRSAPRVAYRGRGRLLAGLAPNRFRRPTPCGNRLGRSELVFLRPDRRRTTSPGSPPLRSPHCFLPAARTWGPPAVPTSSISRPAARLPRRRGRAASACLSRPRRSGRRRPLFVGSDRHPRRRHAVPVDRGAVAPDGGRRRRGRRPGRPRIVAATLAFLLALAALRR